MARLILQEQQNYIHANQIGYREASQPGERFGTVYDIVANVVPFASAAIPLIRGRDFWHYEEKKKGQNNPVYGALRIPKSADKNGNTPIFVEERAGYVLDFFGNWVDKVNRIARTEDHERRRDRVTRGVMVNGLTAVAILGATLLFPEQAQHAVELIPNAVHGLVDLIPNAQAAAELTKNTSQFLVNKELDFSLVGGLIGAAAFGGLVPIKYKHRQIEKTELEFIAQKSGSVDSEGVYHEPRFLIPQIEQTMEYVGVPQEQREATKQAILAVRPIRRKAFENMEATTVRERKIRGNIFINNPLLNRKVKMSQVQDAKNAARELEKVEYAIDYKLNTWSLGYRALQLLQGNLNLQKKRDRIYNNWAYGYKDATSDKSNGEYVRGYHKRRGILQ